MKTPARPVMVPLDAPCPPGEHFHGEVVVTDCQAREGLLRVRAPGGEVQEFSVRLTVDPSRGRTEQVH